MNAEGIKEITKLAQVNSPITLEIAPKYIQVGDKVSFLEHLQGKRDAPRGNFTTDRVKALAQYVKNRKVVAEKQVYVNPDEMAAKVFFDNFNEFDQGHSKDTAYCKLNKTAAFKGLTGIHGKQLGQKAFINWLIDWSINIAGAALAITAVRNIKVVTNKEVKSNVGPMARELSAMEKIEAQANGETALPQNLLFECEPYSGFGGEQFNVSVQAVTEDDSISFLLRIEQYEHVIEALSDRFALIIEQELGIKPEIGTFDPK